MELTSLHERLSRNMKAMILALSSLIELRDVTVLNHSNNVAYASAALARRLDLDPGTVESIEIAAHLHDIGKIGIPDIVLLKNKDEMTEAELEEYRRHPVRGQASIHFVEELNEVGLYIRHHHEWYDGDGVPGRPFRQRDTSRIENSVPWQTPLIRLSSRAGWIGRPDPNSVKWRPSSGNSLIRNCFTVFKRTMRELASTMPASETDTAEVELGIKDLLPGLVVSRDVRSGTGLLLLRRAPCLMLIASGS